MFVKPAKGLRIIDPKTMRPIPDEGTEVPEDTFWTRRRLDGDVVLVDSIPAPTEPPKGKE